MSKRLLTLLLISAFGATAQAKLPAPTLDDAAKAKAAETTARAAWQAKIETWQLCKSQDRIAAKFKSNGKSGDAKATPVVAKSAAAPAAAASGPAAAASTSGTPPAAGGLGPCVDPGPFAYSPPEQKPLETSEAHSPAATAASPPSVKSNSAEMAPAKPSTASAAPAPARKP